MLFANALKPYSLLKFRLKGKLFRFDTGEVRPPFVPPIRAWFEWLLFSRTISAHTEFVIGKVESSHAQRRGDLLAIRSYGRTEHGAAVMRTLSVKRKHKDGPTISLRLGKPVDGAKPFEVYGFAGSIGSLVAFAVYIFWAYVPESWLHALGITYYPSRYWAVAIPTYSMMTVLFILALYASLNFISTPPPQSLYSLCDDHSKPSQKLVLSSPLDDEECPSIHPYSDIPITEVNALLLGPAFEQGLQRSFSREVNGL